MKKCFVLLCCSMFLFLCIGFVNTANAVIMNINFDNVGLNAGDIITDQYSAMGVNFSLIDTPVGYIAGPAARSIAPHPDYYPSATAGIAIVPGNNPSDPFYDIKIDFDTNIDYFSINSFDSDEDVRLRAYLDDVEVANMYQPSGTNHQEWLLELGAIDGGLLFNSVVIDVVPGELGSVEGGPEAFDNLVFNTVPVPEPATMLLLGLGLIGVAGLRKKLQK